TKRIDDVITNGSFPAGDDPNTDWGITESSSGSNRTTQFAYDAQGRQDTTTPPDAGTSWTTKNYYTQLKDGRQGMIFCPKVTTSSVTYYGPARYTVNNKAGKNEISGVDAISSSGLTDASNPLTSWIDETTADPIAALGKGTLGSLKRNKYTSSGHQLTE